METMVDLERARAQLPLLRVQKGVVVRVKVLPAGPYWLKVHWLNGHQYVCGSGGDEECPGCVDNYARLIGFVLVTVLIDGKERLFFLEITPMAWSTFEMSCGFEQVSQDVAVLCDLTRSSPRRPLRFEVVGSCSQETPNTTTAYRLRNAVAVLFQLPLAREHESNQQWHEAVRHLVVGRLTTALAAAAE